MELPTLAAPMGPIGPCKADAEEGRLVDRACAFPRRVPHAVLQSVAVCELVPTETQKFVMVPGHRLMIQVPSGGPHRPLFDFHLHQLMTLVKPKSIPKNYGMRFFRLLFKNWCGHRELNPGRSSGR